MEKYEFGEKNAKTILVQPTDVRELLTIEKEIQFIKELSDADFRLIAFAVDDWNRDLSPAKAPAVLGNEDFGGEGQKTLDAITKEIRSVEKPVYIGGYSLAGLFALWAAYKTPVFSGVAAASPSVWFPGFTDFMKTNGIYAEKVCLSLGNREPNARNPVLASVGENIKKAYDILNEKNVRCFFEWNEGNHFKDSEIRTAKAFAWLLNN
ncbi:MAG: esterase [Clostridia bacterium]|nr:esterase [Clostridia bacterium]